MERTSKVVGRLEFWIFKRNIFIDVQKKSSTIHMTIFSYYSVAKNWELVIWETRVKFTVT